MNDIFEARDIISTNNNIQTHILQTLICQWETINNNGTHKDFPKLKLSWEDVIYNLEFSINMCKQWLGMRIFIDDLEFLLKIAYYHLNNMNNMNNMNNAN